MVSYIIYLKIHSYLTYKLSERMMIYSISVMEKN